MRARLLDMGEVSALRSQSLYHAVAAALTAEGDPVLVVVRPTSPFVSIGVSDSEALEVDLEHCRRESIPVLGRHGVGPALAFDGNQLLFQLVVPGARAAEVGLPGSPSEALPLVAASVVAALEQLGIDAVLGEAGALETGGRAIGHLEAVRIGGAHCFAGSLALDCDAAFWAAVLEGVDAVTAVGRFTSIWTERSEPPVWATVGEALLEALESRLGLELTPSMPTPQEMEAIYEWDGLLAAAEPAGVTVTH